MRCSDSHAPVFLNTTRDKSGANEKGASVAILAQGDVLYGRFSLIGTARSYDCFGICSPRALMGTLSCAGFMGIP